MGNALKADVRVLSRLGFGADEESRAALARDGLAGWVERQLYADFGDDPLCQAKLQQFNLRIKYPEGKDWLAVDEMRPLQWLDAPVDKLWALNDGGGRSLAYPEKIRPRLEVCMATLLRAVYSRWQLRELICDFWHNHFSVNAWDQGIGLGLALYDREVIRRHCFGNFREMLEAVAKSPSMLVSLNNRSSRTGAPNENYARELFELHTLGRDAYLNGLYNHWRDVPGAVAGKPAGYIDQDVYEAARAFTGWAMEDGSGLGGGQNLPRSGRFVYVEAWHDNYQKRVLGNEFDPYQPPLSDGRRVLDLAAFHPATARHLAGKLCVRLVADQPSDKLLRSTAEIWQKNRDKPDQIARVITHIVTSHEFAESAGQKVKRPLELLASFVRASGIDFSPTEPLLYEMEAAGQRLFGWPTPTGHPDHGAHWLGVSALRRRWSLMAGLVDNWWGTGTFNPLAGAATGMTAGEFVATWQQRILGRATPEYAAALLAAAGLSAEQKMNNPGLARRIVAWLAMAPEFQVC